MFFEQIAKSIFTNNSYTVSWDNEAQKLCLVQSPPYEYKVTLSSTPREWQANNKHWSGTENPSLYEGRWMNSQKSLYRVEKMVMDYQEEHMSVDFQVLFSNHNYMYACPRIGIWSYGNLQLVSHDISQLPSLCMMTCHSNNYSGDYSNWWSWCSPTSVSKVA